MTCSGGGATSPAGNVGDSNPATLMGGDHRRSMPPSVFGRTAVGFPTNSQEAPPHEPDAASALGRIRTGDAHLRGVALYPLSYRGLRVLLCVLWRVCSAWMRVRASNMENPEWSQRDSDPRPSRCERDALPACAMAPCRSSMRRAGRKGVVFKCGCHTAGALGRNRTGGAWFRKPSLYPLSYKGVCHLVTRTPQHVSTIRRHSRHPSASCRRVADCDGFRYSDDGV